MQDHSKTSRKSLLSRCKEDRGTAMMEYILLSFIIWVPLASFFALPSSAANGDFGLMGNAIISRYKLMLYIVSLPFP